MPITPDFIDSVASVLETSTPIEKLYCSRCGKCMTMKDGTSVVGIDIRFYDVVDDAFIRKQLGKYCDKDRYCFCYECWLNSLYQRKRNKKETQ